MARSSSIAARPSTSHVASVPGTLTTFWGSSSNSSRISPTISSSRSSIVTMPLVPPYSSTTTAMGVCLRCISRMHVDAALHLGHEENVAPQGRQVRQRARVGVEQEVLGVEVARDVVERAAVREHDARELVGADEDVRLRAVVSIGSDTTSTRGTIEWRAARCEKRITRSNSSPSALPRGDRAALAARIATISSSLKRPSTLRDVRRHRPRAAG